MLGMFINSAQQSNPWLPNAWKIWVDHIMKQKKRFSIKKAALVHGNGATASTSTSGFLIPQMDVLAIKQIFAKFVEGDPKLPESITVQNKTYIIKLISDRQIIAFTGNKYFIISRANRMYIAVVCDSRSKYEEAAHWLRRITNRLIEKDY